MIDTLVNRHTIGFAHKLALANAGQCWRHLLYNIRPDVGEIFWNLTDAITAPVEQFFNDGELCSLARRLLPLPGDILRSPGTEQALVLKVTNATLFHMKQLGHAPNSHCSLCSCMFNALLDAFLGIFALQVFFNRFQLLLFHTSFLTGITSISPAPIN